MDARLTDRVILITGASGGIGTATAKAFAAEGARLALHYRSQKSSAERLRKELGKGVDAVCVGADLRKESEVAGLFKKVAKRFGQIDTVVANAGIWETAS